MLATSQPPSRYSTALRTLGVYPLVRWPFFSGVQRWQDEHRSAMTAWRAQPPPMVHGRPPAAVRPGPPSDRRDALGLPVWTDEQARSWLAWHAPTIAVQTLGDADRWGRPIWSTGPRADGSMAAVPAVDVAQPVVYQRVTSARLGGRWLPQLVYTLWFPERPSTGRFDLLAGQLDGLVVRLTLDEAGEVLLMDTIHACGCYHLFFASERLKARPGPTDEEWLFAPAPWPALSPDLALVIQISSGSHDVMQLTAEPRAARERPPVSADFSYVLEDEGSLRSLPVRTDAAGARRSLYGPDGLVPGTERGERWLFWPMGIASAGAMRQWGHHATAFVGRRFFDDPDLIEQRYERVR